MEKEIEYYASHLKSALKRPLLKFTEISDLDKQGLYFVYREGIVIYVGKTNRSGKKRLSEMAHDYRSHTLNKKFLREVLSEETGHDFKKFNRKTEKSFLDGEIITADSLARAKENVRQIIRGKLQFRFYEFEDASLNLLEHFAIAVLKPAYND